MTYNEQGKRTSLENLAGQVTTTAWDGWSVTYNGENRPVLWQCVSTNSPTPNSSTPTLLSMSYDRMGRRVTKNGQRFVYDGYLQVADNNGNAYVWDPTEPVATRPLVWNCGASAAYYAHDGNKNVIEVVSENSDTEAHYEYAPFGAVVAQSGTSAASNPWRFSSEYAEDDLGLVYYNYRHYEPMNGRWTSRDPEEDNFSNMLYSFCGNDVAQIDSLGLKIVWIWNGFAETNDFILAEAEELSKLREELGLPPGMPLAWTETTTKVSVECKCNLK